MPIFRIDSPGKVGIVTDVPASLLPPEAWSDGRNVRFVDGNAQSGQDARQIAEAPADFEPRWLLPARTDTDLFQMVAGNAAVYAFGANQFSDITRTSGAYTAGYADRWNGGVLNTIPVLNNGKDVPQIWLPIGTGTKLVDLPNWPANTTAKVLRPFGNYLVAFDITESSAHYPYLFMWSNAAEPGAVPDSWDESDKTKLAGRNSALAATQGPIVDALPMGNALAIYKTDANWLLVPNQNLLVFDPQRTPVNGGLLAQDCAQPLPGGTHFVVGMEDIYLFDGQTAQSLVDSRTKRFIYGDISTSHYAQSFVVRHPTARQMWFVYAARSAAKPNRAAVWSWVENVWSFYDLDAVNYAFGGLFNPFAPALTWDTMPGSWNEQPYVWDTNGPVDFFRAVVAARPADVAAMDAVPSTELECFLERRDICYERQTRDGQFRTDPTSYKLLREAWFTFEGAVGTPITIQFGLQDQTNGEIEWLPEQTFLVGQNAPLGVFAQSRLFTLRLSAPSDPTWKLTGYALDIEPLGKFG